MFLYLSSLVACIKNCFTFIFQLFVKRYDRSTVVLSWKTPSLTTVLGHDKSGKILYLMCHLLGYQMKINDKLHAQLWPSDTSCTLQKCKPGKKYTVQLVAMSSIQEKKKLQKWEVRKIYIKLFLIFLTNKLNRYLNLLDIDILYSNLLFIFSNLNFKNFSILNVNH